MTTPTRLLLTLACTLLACGGDSGPGPVDSGLPDERKGSELSDAEAKQLCEARADHAAALISEDDAKHQACTFGGLVVAGGSVETCKTFYDMCIKMDFEEDPEPAGECMLGFELSTCEATIAEIEACFTEEDDANAAAFKSISCNDAATTGDPNPPQAGPACSTAQAKCPGIFVTAGDVQN